MPPSPLLISGLALGLTLAGLAGVPAAASVPVAIALGGSCSTPARCASLSARSPRSRPAPGGSVRLPARLPPALPSASGSAQRALAASRPGVSGRAHVTPRRSRPAGGSSSLAHPPPPPSARHGGAGARTPELSAKPITVNATSVDVNYKAHTVVYRQVVISQGNIVVRADRARTTMGQDQRNSQWTLQGNVRIQAPPRGSLSADRAVVNVLGSRITRATVSGNPAQFAQQRKTGKPARGHAEQIVYDLNKGTVQLSGNAWLSDGRNQMSAPVLTYDLLKDRLKGSSPGNGGRVHITITPQALPAGKKALESKRPPAPPAKQTRPRTRQGASD